MKQYPADRIRNVGLFSHGGAGKTSLAEAMLFDTKATTRLGRVEEGNTVTDFDPDEIKRHISVSAAVAPVEWRDTKINIIDAPGYADFIGDVKSALRVADAAIIVIDASAGVEVGTEQAWRLAEERGIPRLIFINKMDRENADFGRALASARAAFGKAVGADPVPDRRARSSSRASSISSPSRPTVYTDNARGAFRVRPDPGRIERGRGDLPPSARRSDRRAGRRADDALPGGRADLDRGARRRTRSSASRTASWSRCSCGSATRTGASRSCSTPSSTTCRRRPRRERPGTLNGSEVEVSADPSGPTGRPGLQDAGRSARRPRHLLPRLLGLAQVQHPRLERDARRGRAARPALLRARQGAHQHRCHRRRRHRRGRPSWRSVMTGDTLCRPGQADRRSPAIDFPGPSYSASVHPKTKADLDKMGPALQRLVEEDPTLQALARSEHRRDDPLRPRRAARPDRARPDDAPLRRQRRAWPAARAPTARRSRPRRSPSTSTRSRPAAPASTATSSSSWSRCRTPTSSSARRSSAARCRATSSRRSRRASARGWRRGRSPAIPVVNVKVTLTDG